MTKANSRSSKPGIDVIVANHHTGPVVFPRIYAPNATGDPTKNRILFQSRTIPAGEAVPVPNDEWLFRKEKGTVVAALLDRGWISVVKRTGEVDFRTQNVSDLVVPLHLAGDSAEDDSKTPTGGRVQAALDQKRTKAGTAVI